MRSRKRGRREGKTCEKKSVVERVTRDLRRITQFFNHSFPLWWRYVSFWLSRTEHHNVSVKFAYKHFHRVPDSKIDRDTAVIFNIEAGMRASLFSSRYNSSFLYVYRKIHRSSSINILSEQVIWGYSLSWIVECNIYHTYIHTHTYICFKFITWLKWKWAILTVNRPHYIWCFSESETMRYHRPYSLER